MSSTCSHGKPARFTSRRTARSAFCTRDPSSLRGGSGKEREEIDPEWTIFSRDDFLYVVRGALKLELRDAAEVVLEAGDAFVIPAGTAFRGYRWPRDSDEPCLFVAVSAAEREATKEPLREY